MFIVSLVGLLECRMPLIVHHFVVKFVDCQYKHLGQSLEACFESLIGRHDLWLDLELCDDPAKIITRALVGLVNICLLDDFSYPEIFFT